MDIKRIRSDSGGFSYLEYLERYVNGGTQTYSPYASINETSPEYLPASATEYFDIPAVSAPRELVSLALDDPSESVRRLYFRGTSVAFPIHPDTWSMGKVPHLDELKSFPLLAEKLRGAPTATTRTILIREPFGHFLKLHLPRRISRYVRRLRAVSVLFSVMISRDLREITYPSFGYFPETVGASIGEGDDGWGFVVRETVPRPYMPGGRFYIPFFSLYASDIRAPHDTPVIVQLIKYHDADPVRFTLDLIMRPLVASWCAAWRERGIILGAHAQNILLEVDERLLPTRVVHRDLDLQIDPELRGLLGLSTSFPKSRIGIEVHEPRARALSLKYDAFMGHHLFEYIARVLHEYFGVDRSVLQEGVKEEFHRSLPDAHEYFDDRIYYYAPKPSAFNEYPLVPAGVPEWR